MNGVVLDKAGRYVVDVWPIFGDMLLKNMLS